jgi:hypothetical protein
LRRRNASPPFFATLYNAKHPAIDPSVVATAWMTQREGSLSVRATISASVTWGREMNDESRNATRASPGAPICSASGSM